MNTIIPAIIPTSFDHLTAAVSALRDCTKEFQVDIVDGVFVPFTSWPYRGSGSVMMLRTCAEDAVIEVDLMIESPERVVPIYVSAGVQKVVVHLESVTEHASIYEHRDMHGYMLGLSIMNDTPFEMLEAQLKYADYVQLMGIRAIGSQGQPFDEEVLVRIHKVRAIRPDIEISIDGSVNAETLPRLREAGANRFVAGSAIFAAADPAHAYTALTHL